MDQRVYLHVGLPGSGAASLQASLLQNREPLHDCGFLAPTVEQMFLAALDLRGTHRAWGRSRAEVRGSWDALCRTAREHDGTTVVSQDLLGAASSRRITAAMTMLRDVDVHVVVTARDPARQAAAEWQQGVRHGRRLTFEEFRAQVLDSSSETDYARRFRTAQDLPALLTRWAGAVPADHVHVVCAPPTHLPPELLWWRFGEVVGFDAGAMPPDVREPSLGTDEVDLLRRVNVALDKRLAQPGYGEVVERGYAHRLVEAGRSAPPVVPAQLYDDLGVVAERWIKEIDRAGYPVHGDLADLLPVPPQRPVRHPDDVDASSQVATAATATAGLLVDVHALNAEVERLTRKNAKLRKRRKKLKRRLRATETGTGSADTD